MSLSFGELIRNTLIRLARRSLGQPACTVEEQSAKQSRGELP